MRWGLFSIVVLTAACAGKSTPSTPDPSPEPSPTAPPAVILFIGDGMGPQQLDAAGWFANGAPGTLFLEQLPYDLPVRTASLSGITDSAASATAMATGSLTYNRRIGQDREGNAVETLIELANARGMGTGVISTASLAHATPGAFTAHVADRGDYDAIAADAALDVRADVMLGGGAQYFDAHLAALVGEGYDIVKDAHALENASRPGMRVAGFFADNHMEYILDRGPSTVEPMLSDMTAAALAILGDHEGGFLLVVEGARIDMAEHMNDIHRSVAETLELDESVRIAAEWAGAHENASILVTADHECGGLRVLNGNGAGTLPDVTWRWNNHTNARIKMFGSGPAAARLDGQVIDHRSVHATIAAQLTGTEMLKPKPVLLPDGNTADLSHLAAEQINPSGFGEGRNRLDALRVDGDEYGLAIGIDGLFEVDTNALVILLDVDPGDGTGPARLEGALSDTTGVVDAILSGSSLDAPAEAGFGADFALVSFGAAQPKEEELLDVGGLRGLADPTDLAWHAVSINYGENVRRATDGTPVAGEGFEAYIPWSTLGLAAAGAEVGVFAVIVNDDGGYTSNQALPPFAPGTQNPGRDLTPIPGVYRFVSGVDPLR